MFILVDTVNHSKPVYFKESRLVDDNDFQSVTTMVRKRAAKFPTMEAAIAILEDIGCDDWEIVRA